MSKQKTVKLCPQCEFKIESPRFYCPACGTELESLQEKTDYKALIRTAISLKIDETKKMDSDPNIVRINDDLMRKIGVKKNDIVVLLGKKVSAGIVRRTIGLNYNFKHVRVKPLTRSNLGKKIGDSIGVNKIEPKIAREITLLPYQNQKSLGVLPSNRASISRLIRKKHSKIPLALYDKISLSSIREMGRYTLIVASIKPKAICLIDDKTKVEVIKSDNISNFKTAVKVYKHVLEVDGNDLGILISLVNIFFLEENYRNALVYLDKLLSIHPKNPFGLTKKGKVFLFQGDSEKAIRIFKEVLELYPESNEIAHSVYNIYLRDCLYYAAVCYAQIGKYEVAVSYLNKLLKIDQNNKEAKITLGVCYFKLGDSEKGISLIKQALEMEYSQTPEGYHLKALESFGRLYYKFKERFERIEKTFDSYNFFAWKVLGDIYYETENYEEAKENYLLALKKAPRDSRLWLNLGLIFIRVKDFEQAEKHLKMVLKIDSEAFPAQLGLAGVYYKTQKYDTALELINEVLKHVPNEKHVIEFREKIQSKMMN